MKKLNQLPVARASRVLIAAAAVPMFTTPTDMSSFPWFVAAMLVLFFFAGVGNASTFKQMPMIFERRQAGGVIGWTAAIAAFGPFFFGVGVTTLGPVAFYSIGIAWAVMCVGITWWRYARPGAPKPG